MKLDFSFSDNKECEMIHSYSLDILENVGLSVYSEKAKQIFKSRGARVDGCKVFIKPKTVEEYLSYVPRAFTIKSLNHSITIGKGELCTIPTYGATYVRYENESKPSSRKDFVLLSKLNHMNKNICMSCPYLVEPFDIPFEYRDIYKILMTLKYSDKPTFSITRDERLARFSIKLVKEYFDICNEYVLLGNVNMISPLIMSKNTADVIIVHSEEKQPLMISCGSGLSGLNAPPTLASNFLLSNTVTLSGIVLSQMICPGLPVVYGFPLFGVNPNTANVALGDPSTALFSMAATEMGRYYNLPVRTGGTYTDSELLDYQSGFESFMNLFASLFSKTDIIMHTFGMENSLNTVSYSKYILDETLLAQVIKFLNGFEINDVTLMLDEIKKTGSSGDYMNIRNLRLIRKYYSPYPYKTGELSKKINNILKERLESYKLPESDEKQKYLIKKYLPEKYID